MTSERELLAVAIMLLTIPMHSIAAKMKILFFIIVFCYRTFAEFSTRRELSFILILLCAKLHNNSVISNAGIQKSLFLGIALHILHRQSLVSDMDSMHIVFHLQFNLPSSSFLLLLCQFFFVTGLYFCLRIA